MKRFEYALRALKRLYTAARVEQRNAGGNEATCEAATLSTHSAEH